MTLYERGGEKTKKNRWLVPGGGYKIDGVASLVADPP